MLGKRVPGCCCTATRGSRAAPPSPSPTSCGTRRSPCWRPTSWWKWPGRSSRPTWTSWASCWSWSRVCGKAASWHRPRRSSTVPVPRLWAEEYLRWACPTHHLVNWSSSRSRRRSRRSGNGIAASPSRTARPWTRMSMTTMTWTAVPAVWRAVTAPRASPHLP